MLLLLGEYQVHLMFPPPLITHPPLEDPAAADKPANATTSAATETVEDNPLADLDDGECF